MPVEILEQVAVQCDSRLRVWVEGHGQGRLGAPLLHRGEAGHSHANTAVAAHNRLGLEKLCRYGMRPAFSHQRLSLTEQGKVLYTLRRPWPTAGGVSALCFTPLEFLRRLSPLIPPPYAHLIRYFGLFAPNAKYRDCLPAAPVTWTGIRPEAFIRGKGRPTSADPPSPCTPSPSEVSPSTLTPGPSGPRAGDDAPHISSTTKDSIARPATTDTGPHPCNPTRHVRPRRQRLSWAELLRRVFAVDVLVCPRCLGPMTILAALSDPPVLAKILTHLGLPSTSPALAPAQRRGQLDFFDELGDSGADESTEPWGDPPHEVRPGPSRDPAADEMDLELGERNDTGEWGGIVI